MAKRKWVAIVVGILLVSMLVACGPKVDQGTITVNNKTSDVLLPFFYVNGEEFSLENWLVEVGQSVTTPWKWDVGTKVTIKVIFGDSGNKGEKTVTVEKGTTVVDFP